MGEEKPIIHVCGGKTCTHCGTPVIDGDCINGCEELYRENHELRSALTEMSVLMKSISVYEEQSGAMIPWIALRQAAIDQADALLAALESGEG